MPEYAVNETSHGSPRGVWCSQMAGYCSSVYIADGECANKTLWRAALLSQRRSKTKRSSLRSLCRPVPLSPSLPGPRSSMVNIVRVKRKRGLPSPAGRLYVDVNDDRLVADNLLTNLSLGSPEASLADGAASSGRERPRRAKRYRRIIGNMTLLELEAQALQEGFETAVAQLGPSVRADECPAVTQSVTQSVTSNDAKEVMEQAREAGALGEVGIEEATAQETGGAMHGASIDATGKRKQCSMIYAVVKRRRENVHQAMASGSGRGPEGLLELDPLRRLGGTYRVCDLEFTPSTPDVKSRAGEEDELYDLYVEEEEDGGGRGGDGCSVENERVSSSCAVVYVDDADFFMPEFDEDHEASDGFGTEDSNAEEYYLNDYPEEEDDEGDDGEDDDGMPCRVARAVPGWDSDEGGSVTDSDAWDSDDF